MYFKNEFRPEVLQSSVQQTYILQDSESKHLQWPVAARCLWYFLQGVTQGKNQRLVNFCGEASLD